MKVIIAISTLMAFTAGSPTGLVAPVATISAPISSQFHAQDDLGQYTYGYTNPLSAKTEARSIDGAVLGSYSYVDPNGKVQSVEYAADDQGFRVSASNLPVAPVLQAVPAFVVPAPVQDTPEVVEARAKHLEAVEEAVNRAGQEQSGAEANNSVESSAARSAIALKSGDNPIAITTSGASAFLPLAYRPAVYQTPAVAVKSFVTPAIAIKTTPVSTSFSYSYGINNFLGFDPAFYHYPGYTTFAAHLPAPQVVSDATIVENAELAKEKSEPESKEEKSSQ